MKRSFSLYRVSLSFIILLMVSCSGSSSNEVTFYFVRHAEKTLADTTDNPPLTDAGCLRAETLVAELNQVHFDRIFSTKYQRNINTVKPLSDAQKIEIETYEWHDWQPVIDDLLTQNKGVFMICGHGDNILPMISYLGGELPLEELGKHEYDKLFKISVTSEKTVVEMTTF